VVNLGVSPSIRRAGKSDSKAFDYWMSQLLVRRTGQAPLQSTFGAAHELFAGDTFIVEVNAISVELGDDGVYTAKVRHGNGYSYGYPTKRMERHDGLSHVVLGMDHGLRIDGGLTEELYFPQRKIEGINTFAIPLAMSR
jgi:hypothetical protein